MLNYIQRISEYKRKNYFQVNGQYLDIYTTTLPLWSQDVDVARDILSFVSSIDLADQYELLNVRFIGPNIDDNVKNTLMSTFSTANTLLGVELGESETWASIKAPGSNKRHFLSIVISKPKTEEPIHNEKPKKQSKTVRRVSDSINPV